jgi:hypothetical protein
VSEVRPNKPNVFSARQQYPQCRQRLECVGM